MPFGKWFLILLCGYFFAIMGNIVGTVVNGALLMPFGYNFNNINQSMEIMKSMSNLSGFIFELLTVGIMGPVMEELLFRKMFIDNYSKYGMGAAILASAVSFGLFHGNFSQFFMATALGILFGYVYSLTWCFLWWRQPRASLIMTRKLKLSCAAAENPSSRR